MGRAAYALKTNQRLTPFWTLESAIEPPVLKVKSQIPDLREAELRAHMCLRLTGAITHEFGHAICGMQEVENTFQQTLVFWLEHIIIWLTTGLLLVTCNLKNRGEGVLRTKCLLTDLCPGRSGLLKVVLCAFTTYILNECVNIPHAFQLA